MIISAKIINDNKTIRKIREFLFRSLSRNSGESSEAGFLGDFNMLL